LSARRPQPSVGPFVLEVVELERDDPARPREAQLGFVWGSSCLFAAIVVAAVALIDANWPTTLDEPLPLRILRRWAEHPLRVGAAGMLVAAAVQRLRGVEGAPETTPEGDPEPPRP